MVVVVVLVEFHNLVERHRAVEICRRENAAREAAAHRDELDFRREACLHRCQRLADFCQVLVLERLVDRHVLV